MSPAGILLLIAVNGAAWAAVHLGFSWLGTRVPGRWFQPSAALFRPRSWEGDGRRYERLFRVHTWKHKLPDGAALFRGGFRKAALTRRDPHYLAMFARETCRGEAVHWATAAAAPVFFLWNPPWAGGIMLLYAAAANMPCIITQRYNRLRLLRAAHKAAHKAPSA